MKMTIPNLQIHRTDFYPETTEYWKIIPGALASFWAIPEATGLDLTPYLNTALLKFWYGLFQLVLELKCLGGTLD